MACVSPPMATAPCGGRRRLPTSRHRRRAEVRDSTAVSTRHASGRHDRSPWTRLNRTRLPARSRLFNKRRVRRPRRARTAVRRHEGAEQARRRRDRDCVHARVGRLLQRSGEEAEDNDEFASDSPALAAFIERLAALVPRPHKNLVIYSGVLAPNAKLRSKVIAYGAAEPSTPGEAPEVSKRSITSGSTTPKSGGTNYTWADLMRRAFGVDVLHCQHCGPTQTARRRHEPARDPRHPGESRPCDRRAPVAHIASAA